jgi:hypothetical protein
MLHILLSLCLPLKILGTSIFSYATPKARWEQQGSIVLRSGVGIFELNVGYTPFPAAVVPAIEPAESYSCTRHCAYDTVINQPNICKQRK